MIGHSLGIVSGQVGVTAANRITQFTLGQAYALSVGNGGTAFREFLNEVDAPQLFRASVRPMGPAGLFD